MYKVYPFSLWVLCMSTFAMGRYFDTMPELLRMTVFVVSVSLGVLSLYVDLRSKRES